MNTVPLQFLVGVTRLMAIYFGLTALGSLAAAAAQYATVRYYASSAIVQQMPVEWGLYAPGLAISLILAIGTWFAAPFICRLALSSKETQPAERDTTLEWNDLPPFPEYDRHPKTTRFCRLSPVSCRLFAEYVVFPFC